MAIKELTVKGFRSLRDVRWTPGRLNVLIGPNGSGKSNLLQAVELLAKGVQGKLSDAIVRQGGMGSLLWDARESFLTWEVRLDDAGGQDLVYHLDLWQLGKTSNYKVEFEYLTAGTDGHVDRSPGGRPLVLKSDEGTVPYPDPVPDDQPLVALVAGPFGSPVARRFQQRLAGWSIYQDLRVDGEAPLRRAAISRFEETVSPDGQNLTGVLHTWYASDRDFKRTVDDAMRAAFGTEYEELIFRPAAEQRIELGVRWRSLKTVQTAASLSDGTLRFLLMIAILANPKPGELMAIDEPETGLHPSMFPLVAELAAGAAERGAQVILTTHSPQFLDAFGEKPPTTTVAEWSDGETRLSVLDEEELSRWLEHYSLGAMFRSGELEGLA